MTQNTVYRWEKIVDKKFLETLDKTRMADLMQQMAQMAQMVMGGQAGESFEGDGLFPFMFCNSVIF